MKKACLNVAVYILLSLAFTVTSNISIAATPTASNNKLLVPATTPYVIKLNHLGYADSDGDEFNYLTIKVVRTNVFLDRNGNNIMEEDERLGGEDQVTSTDIENNKFKVLLQPPDMPFNAGSIQFKVNDGADDSTETYTLNFEPKIAINSYHSVVLPTGPSGLVDMPNTMNIPMLMASPDSNVSTTYILKSLPRHGTLKAGMVDLSVDSSFMPSSVKYLSNSQTNPKEDKFTFIVQHSPENVSDLNTVDLYIPQPQEGLAKTVIYTESAYRNHVSLTLSPDGTKAYGVTQYGSVVNYDRNPFNNGLTTVETLPGSSDGFGAVISDDGNTLYVSEEQRLAVYQKNDQGRLTLVDSFGEFDSTTNQISIGESVYAGRNIDGFIIEASLSGGVISPDGNSFYLVGSNENAPITYFDRDPTTGLLTLDNNKKIETSLSRPWSLKFSPDGKYLYVMDADTRSKGAGEGGIAIYSRNSSTGELTEVSTIKNITDPHGNPLKLAGVVDMLISTDGKTAYTLDIRYASNDSPDSDDGSILIFDRNIETGELNFRHSFNTRHLGFREKSLQRLAFSPDESKIYATTDHNRVSDVLIFDRNTTTGELRKSIDIVNNGSYVTRDDDIYGNEAHPYGRVAGVTVTAKGDLYLTDAYRLSLFEIEPRVSTVSAPAGVYSAGDTVNIEVKFNRNVEVTGVPHLTLSNEAVALYNSGSGSDTLIFNYVIGSDDFSTNLNYASVDALSLNNGSIKDSKALDAVIKLPPLQNNTSLAGNENLIINRLPTAIASSYITNRDSELMITLRGTDLDNDNLTYSITTPPSQGRLRVLSNNQQVVYEPRGGWIGPDSFKFQAIDIHNDRSLAATISLTVLPEITMEPIPLLRVIQGENFSYTPALSNVNNRVTTFSATNRPSWLTLNTTNGQLSGTPQASDVSSQSFNLMMSYNAGTVTVQQTIQMIVLGSVAQTTQDKDANSDGINDHLAASFGTEDTDKDGIPDALERLISDDLSTVTTTSDTDQDGMPDVAEIMAGRDPKVDDQATAGAPSIIVTQAALALASTGVQSSYTQATLGVSVSDTSLTAVAYFKTATCKDNLPYNYKTVCKAVPETGFTSGQHDIWWITEDSKGNWAVAEQSLTILPAIAFASDLILAGQSGTGTLTTQLSLNGPVATDQDFTVPFTVSGSAQTGSDYTLSATEFTFKVGELDSQPITITVGNNPISGNELILTLNESATVIASVQGSIDKNTQFVVLGEKPTQTITVVQGTTYAPMLSSLTGTQAQGTDNEVSGLFFEKSNGAVTLSFSSYDPDGGAYSYDWSKSDADIVANLSSTTVQAPELNTAALESKSYRLEVSVADSTTNQPAATLSAVLNLFEGMSLTNKDSDGDGTPDSEEGFKDSDGDGVMDYLDAFDNMANSLPTINGSAQNHLVTVDTGLRIKLGETAQFARTGAAQVDLSHLEQFGNKGQAASNTNEVKAEELDAVFDYEVENLSVPADLSQGGLSANIVLPLTTPLNAGSDFLKYNATDGWAKFIIDDNNKLAWAGWKDGIEGQCPLSNSEAYSSDESLKAGKYCLRVTIQDGGANDADNTVNGRIVDPLAVSKQAKDFTKTVTAEGTSGGGSSSFWALLLLAFGAKARTVMRRQC